MQCDMMAEMINYYAKDAAIMLITLQCCAIFCNTFIQFYMCG